jgi:hypothetical protein
MSHTKIPQEQPPVEETARREWLTRMMVLINGAIEFLDSVTMYYKNLWQEGRYYPQDVVRDDEWTMVCIRPTIDKAAPQKVGSIFPSMPDSPAWATESDIGLLETGHTFVFTKTGIISYLQIWPSVVSPVITHKVQVSNITKGTINSITLDDLVAGKWNNIPIPDPLVRSNDVVEVSLITDGTGSNDYVEITDYWLSNSLTFAAVSGFLKIDGVISPKTESFPYNAYGVDIGFTEAVISDDWEYLAKAQAPVTPGVLQYNIQSSFVKVDQSFSAYDYTVQTPIAVDVPMQVLFGPGSANSKASVSATGDIEILESNTYKLAVHATINRNSPALVANILFYFEVNGVPDPESFIHSLDSQVDTITKLLEIRRNFNEGDIIRVYMVVDSSGNFDGFLTPFIPVNGAVPTTPSAGLHIEKRVLV